MILAFLAIFSFPVHAEFDVSGLKPWKFLPQSGPATLGCAITAQTQNLVTSRGTWSVQTVDIKAGKILLWYSNPNYVPGSVLGFFKNFIFVWEKDSQDGPWVVYAGDEEINSPKVSTLGHVAFGRYEPPTPTAPAKGELVVCSMDPNRGLSQFAPYACATNPLSRRVVDTVVYNFNRNLFNMPVPPTQPDGTFDGWAWVFDGAQDILVFSRRQYSLLNVTLNAWPETTGTTLTPAIETLSGAPIGTTAKFQITGSDFSTFSYVRMAAYGLEYKGATLSGTLLFQPVRYLIENIFAPYALNGSTFASIPTGQQFQDRYEGLFTPVQSATLPARLLVRSSVDGYTIDHPAVTIPNSLGRKVMNPKHTLLFGLSSYVVAATSIGPSYNTATRVEVIVDNTPYTGASSPESFTHIATVAPLPPYTDLDVVSASWNGILARQHTGTILDGPHVLIECH